MKKNRTMRLAALLLVLTLITSCFVGGTFAKYTTQAEGNDTARVAKFGVELAVASDVFKPQYDSDDSISVKADTVNGKQDDVVAPGTAGTATIFTIAGAPEVDVRVTATLDVGGALNMVTLPAGEDYLDWTTAAPADTYDQAANYYPVVWTLKQGDTVKATGNLEAIQTYLTGTLSGVYQVEGDTFDALNGTYTLSWTWAFDGNDKADTTLGQIAAEKDTVAGAVLNETFSFNIKVEQIDVHTTT